MKVDYRLRRKLILFWMDCIIVSGQQDFGIMNFEDDLDLKVKDFLWKYQLKVSLRMLKVKVVKKKFVFFVSKLCE